MKVSTHTYRSILYNHNQLHLSDIEKRAVLIVDKKNKDVHVCKEQYPEV
jgi:hypothetical protein